MERKFITHNNIPIHYIYAGTGPAVLLLHPSPLSSTVYVPFISQLLQHYTVIAIDTPGYGLSQLPSPIPNNIYDYIPYIKAVLDAEHTTQCMVYGSATGAQLGIALATLHPRYVQHLWLDNAAHFTATQRAALIQHYFINLAPQPNGSHLTQLWQHVSKGMQYFPWYSNRASDLYNSTLPEPDVIQQICTQYLQAGVHYAVAYKCALQHEDAAHVQALTVPTTILYWLHSPILKYIQQLIAYPMPKHITVREITSTGIQRYNDVKKMMLQL